VPGDRLTHYSKAFKVVEVNSTFYEMPDSRRVKSWRKRVHNDFSFTVRCNRRLTHNIGLKPVDEAFKIYDKMVDICELLRSKILHLQTSKDSRIEIEEVQDFFSSISRDVKLVWEVRGEKIMEEEFRRRLYNLMEDYGVIHCVDLSVDEPAHVNDEVTYTRLFGKGDHNLWQFDDLELKSVKERIVKQNSRIAIAIAHTKKMYLDAARLMQYVEDGSYLQTTKSEGLDAVIEVLREDAVFPCTKNQLINAQGWKVFDVSKGRRERLSTILEKIPNRTYKNMSALKVHLKTISIE